MEATFLSKMQILMVAWNKTTSAYIKLNRKPYLYTYSLPAYNLLQPSLTDLIKMYQSPSSRPIIHYSPDYQSQHTPEHPLLFV